MALSGNKNIDPPGKREVRHVCVAKICELYFSAQDCLRQRYPYYASWIHRASIFGASKEEPRKAPLETSASPTELIQNKKKVVVWNSAYRGLLIPGWHRVHSFCINPRA